MSTIDWTILDEPGVMDTCLKQATKVAARFKGVTETDDLLQEAYITVAAHAREARSYLDGGRPGLLANMVWADLMDIARAEGRRKTREVSWEVLKADL